jgi:hypothetical protein
MKYKTEKQKSRLERNLLIANEYKTLTADGSSKVEVHKILAKKFLIGASQIRNIIKKIGVANSSDTCIYHQSE